MFLLIVCLLVWGDVKGTGVGGGKWGSEGNF